MDRGSGFCLIGAARGREAFRCYKRVVQSGGLSTYVKAIIQMLPWSWSTGCPCSNRLQIYNRVALGASFAFYIIKVTEIWSYSILNTDTTDSEFSYKLHYHPADSGVTSAATGKSDLQLLVRHELFT